MEGRYSKSLVTREGIRSTSQGKVGRVIIWPGISFVARVTIPVIGISFLQPDKFLVHVPAFLTERPIFPFKQQGVFLKLQRGELNSYNKLFAYVQGVINLAAQEEIFALAPLSEKEQESIANLSSLIASIERFIGKVQEQDKAKHLEKAVFHSDVSPERVDYIITSLQKIRRTILVGDGVKKAMQAA